MNQKEDFFKNCMECRRKSLKNSLFLEIFYVKIQESLSPGPAGYYSKKKKKYYPSVVVLPLAQSYVKELLGEKILACS